MPPPPSALLAQQDDPVETAVAAVSASPDALVAEWAPGPDPAGPEVRGEGVWSSDSQACAMRLEGLRVKAPQEYQYQLWISDRDRDERYPVDGGVFDVPQGGEVVSSRERIAMVAQVTDQG